MEKVILGGGYTCSICGKYQRTSSICHHNNLIINNMKQLPTAEEMFIFYSNLCQFEEGSPEYLIDKEDFIKAMQGFAKIHIQAALESAAENTKEWHGNHGMLKQSILNAYPLTNIK